MRLITFVAASAASLVVASCGTDHARDKDEFRQLVEDAENSTDPVEQEQLLTQAVEKAASGTIVATEVCSDLAELAAQARNFEAGAARRTLQLLALLPCPSHGQYIYDAGAGEWLANGSITRGFAFGLLAESQQRQIWPNLNIEPLAQQFSSDRSDYLRATGDAFLLRYLEGAERLALLSRMAADESPLVMEVAGTGGVAQ